MKTLSTILLAASLSFVTATAFAQGNGSGNSSVRGGSTGSSSNAGAGVNAGSGRSGGDVSVGGHGSKRLSTGIGNSRVNSAISGQGRARGRGR